MRAPVGYQAYLVVHERNLDANRLTTRGMAYSKEHAADAHVVLTLQDVTVNVQLQCIVEVITIGEVVQRLSHWCPTVVTQNLATLPIPYDISPVVMNKQPVDLACYIKPRTEHR